MLFLAFSAILIIMIAPFDNVVFGIEGEGGNGKKHSIYANVHVFGAKDEQNQRANLFTSLNTLYKFEAQILQEFKNFEICSSAEGIDDKMDDNKKVVKSILCGPVKSLDKIFTNFTKKFEKGGELHNIPFHQFIWAKNRAMNNWDLIKIHVKKIEQKEWDKLKTVFPPFFGAIQKVIFMFMKKVRQYSTKLIGEPKVIELASDMGEEIKHTGEQELKQLFLSKMEELKETENLQEFTEIAYGHHNVTEFAPGQHGIEIAHGHHNITEIAHGHHNITEIAHGHHNITEIAHGHHNITEIAHGHHNVSEIAHGHHNITEIAHGHHNVTEIAHGHHNVTEIAHGHHNVSEIAHGHHNITEIAHGHHNVTEIAHGHHNVTEIAHGHHNMTEIAYGHHNITEIAYGHHNITEIAYGHHNITEIAYGHHNITEIAYGHHNITEIAHGYHNVTKIAHGHNNVTEIAHGHHNMTEIVHGQKLAEIVYEIGLIAPAIHKSNKNIAEDVEFVMKVFVANSIFCGKIMKNEQLLHIVEG